MTIYLRRVSALVLIACFAGCLLFAIAARAAEFSPELEAQLAARGVDQWVSAIVVLESPLDIRAIDERLHVEGAALSKRHRDVIEALQYNAKATQPAFVQELEHAKSAGDVLGYTAYWIENIVVVRAKPSVVAAWKSRADIRYATENFVPLLITDPVESTGERERNRETLDSTSTTSGLDAVGATRVLNELGISGLGALVATIDGGVDLTHPALNARWRGWTAPHSECWFDALGSSPNLPGDEQGHGTHVMGTICGREISGMDTNTVGVAPDAEWIATNAVGQAGGEQLDNDVLAAFQWLTDPDGNPLTMDDVPDVIQNSWGVNGALGYAQCFDFWNSAILNCEAAGPVVVFSAGNDGTAGLRSPATYEINATQIFSVGAVDADHYAEPYPLASFSSQGPTPCQPSPGAIKPELVAPGVNVYSSDLFGQYQWRSGTSMAGPHVAGTIALMRQACPECDHTTLKQLLISTAIDSGYGVVGPDNQFGAGFLDAYAAVVATLGYGRVQGIIRGSQNQLVSGALVRNPAGSEHSHSEPNGEYSIALPPGTYTLEFSRFGYVSQSVPGVAVTEGAITPLDIALVNLPTFTVSGTVLCYDFPAAGAIVEVPSLEAVRDTTDSLGHYELHLPAGVYDFRAWADGCDTVSVSQLDVNGNLLVNFPLQHNPEFSCSEPDAAGYAVCEDGDFGGPVYSWLEISPMLGGPGTATGLTGDDQSRGFPLPFTFRMYGQDFDSVYVSTNGVVSFDSTTILHTNRVLPAPDLGHACAVYWDDFYPLSSGGDISYYYFAAANALIVEWYNLEHFPGIPPRETFQIWLYNPLTNYSPTGDSQIRFQYATVDPASSTTIGLQNGTTLANQYSHLGALQSNAQGVENGRVITFGGYQAIGGTIQGVAHDCFGAPADSVVVTFPGSSFGPVMTDAFGFYTIGLAPDIYDVQGSKSPCSNAFVSGVPLNSAQTITVNLTLNPPPVLHGTVTDCLGLPAANASVTLPGSEYPVAITDSNGFYSYTLAAGRYVVRADNVFCSYAQSDTTTVGDAQTVTVNLTLQAPPRLQGTVTHCAGGAASNAIVSLPGFGYLDVVTDHTGGYAFTVVNGSYQVRADNGICSPVQSAMVSISDLDTVIVDLVLGPPPAISGIVTDCFGLPAAYATVTLPGSAYPAVIADSAGRWLVEVLPDTYRVRADNASCSSIESADVVAVDGDTVVVNLELKPPPAIAGFVHDCRGGPASGCSVTIDGVLASTAVSDANGFFLLHVPDDTFAVTADNAWCSRAQVAGVATFDNDTTMLDITLRGPAAISGTIQDCGGGPAPLVAVDFNGDSAVQVQADEYGNFFAQLYPDTYVVGADNAICSHIQSAAQYLLDGDTVFVSLTLAPPPRLQGTVSLCTGGPASGATVSLPGSGLPDATTDGSGFYSFDVLPDSYFVAAGNSTCSATQSGPVYVADGGVVTVNLILAPAATISGQVMSCSGGPAVGATVELLSNPPRTLITGGSGQFNFSAVPAGTYDLAAALAGCSADTLFNLAAAAGQLIDTLFTLVVDSAYECYVPVTQTYQVCENVDPDGPVFNWRGITPAEGGAGTLVSGLTDDNFVGPITIPFAFKFYGVTYTGCYIGSNGVVSFGSGVNAAYDNCLPQPGMPAALFAGWDDLDPTEGSAQVATRYDVASHTFIIEYYRVSRCCDSSAPRSFEIVLFDRAVYPTVTGDNDILFQYQSPLMFPESMTVGIQNSGGTQSFTHLCTGVPGLRSTGIAPGRAILFSTGRAAPDVDITLSTLAVSQAVPPGGSATQTIQLCNVGASAALTWSFNFYQYPPLPVAVFTIPSAIGQAPGRHESRTIDAQGGPDGGGYSWKDSNEPDGPVYHWVELRGRGSNTGLHDNDAYTALPLPWYFPLYGDSFATAYVSVNGNLHFTNQSVSGLNRPLPTAASPNAMLAVFWDDLTDSTFGNIYYLNDSLNQRYIVQWDSVGRYRQAGAYTFQCLLYRSGEIVYQYKYINGATNSASIGIENRLGVVGTQIAYNQAYVTANMTIRIATFEQWLRISGANGGTLQPGQCAEVSLNFVAGDLPAGIYGGAATVESNDPDENPVLIPVQFTVGALQTPGQVTLMKSVGADQLVLRWQATGAPYYRVFSAAQEGGPYDTLEATTSATALTLAVPGNSVRFYIVIASTEP